MKNPGMGQSTMRFENNRGREAEKPTEIPVRGWRDIFRRVKAKGQGTIFLLLPGCSVFLVFLPFSLR